MNYLRIYGVQEPEGIEKPKRFNFLVLIGILTQKRTYSFHPSTLLLSQTLQYSENDEKESDDEKPL